MQGADLQAVLAELSPPVRLAAAHAPSPSRCAWVGLLALDERLGRVARRGGEPILAQLRLTWWRDRLGESPEQWPAGEPLLALLGAWQGELGVLAALVDDYERTIVDPDATDRSVLADARIAAMVALARVIGAPDRPEAVEAVAMRWATGEGGQPVRLSRLMRPLAILAELGAGKRGLAGWLGIVRLGMFGR
jgi:phytoene synthase